MFKLSLLLLLLHIFIVLFGFSLLMLILYGNEGTPCVDGAFFFMFFFFLLNSSLSTLYSTNCVVKNWNKMILNKSLLVHFFHQTSKSSVLMQRCSIRDSSSSLSLSEDRALNSCFTVIFHLFKLRVWFMYEFLGFDWHDGPCMWSLQEFSRADLGASIF